MEEWSHDIDVLESRCETLDEHICDLERQVNKAESKIEILTSCLATVLSKEDHNSMLQELEQV
jgi:chaperonin cofactor prefoldin